MLRYVIVVDKNSYNDLHVSCAFKGSYGEYKYWTGCVTHLTNFLACNLVITNYLFAGVFTGIGRRPQKFLAPKYGLKMRLNRILNAAYKAPYQKRHLIITVKECWCYNIQIWREKPAYSVL